jgi:AraC-like DNA-binding protein
MKNNKKALADILLRWSVSYVLISLIAIIMFIFCTRQYSEALRSEMEYSNSILVESMQMQIDEAIGELRIFGSKATLNTTVNKLRQRTSYDDISRYELYELVQELGSNMVTNTDLLRSFLYFPQMDFLLSGHYYNTSREFYQISMTSYGFSYSDWYDIISQTYKEPQIFQLSCRDGSFLTVLIRPVDSRTRQTFSVNAIMVLDFSQVIKRSETFTREDNQICIVDQKHGSVIAENEIPDELKEFLLSQEMEEPYGSLLLETETSKAVVSYIQSRFEDWKYVIVTPQQMYIKKAADLQNLVIFCCVMYLIVSVVIVCYSLRRHYRPIRMMMDTLKQEGGSQEGTDAYEYLSSSIEKLMSKNKENRSRIQTQQQAIREELLRRLVTAEKSYDLPDTKMLEQYGIFLENGYYMVLSYRLENTEEIMQEVQELGADSDELAWFILSNVTEENLKDMGLSVSIVTVKNLLVFMIQSDSQEEFLNNVKKAVQITSEFVGRCFKLFYRVALSEVMEGSVTVLGDAFRQTKRVFEYQKSTVYASITAYGDINVLPTDTMLNYPLDVENRLFNSILAGEEEKACEIIAGLLKDNQSNCLTPEAMQFLVSNIASTIMRAANRISRGRASISQKHIMEVCAGKDIKRVQKELKNMVAQACSSVKAAISEEKSSQKISLYEGVKSYVEEHYTDAAMSVNDIAEQYKVSPASLSKQFKEAEGENLSQYINRVRLEHAKMLLLDNVKLEEVAQRSGYGSQRTFLRIFKQYIGVTPSQYRDLEEKKRKEDIEGEQN